MPKCIVHRTGGVLLQHLKEHRLQLDIRAGDRVAYFTTCGWMMWNWLASVPASGATAVLYDGNPFHPGPQRLWDLVADEALTFLGVSAKYLEAVEQSGYRPADSADLSTLRTLASTGSPLAPESFEWVTRAVAPGASADGLHLASISGGTDICGCFVCGDPTSAVHAGEIQRPALGMAVDVWSEAGEPVGAGERGELVCTRAFPSMPVGFWDDGPLGEVGPRYRAAYFERIPGVWAQGDFATWTEHGGMVIHGRSDTTLNPGGVRIGTAEIYRQVERIPSVVESLVFGQQVDNDVRIVLLVRLAEGSVLDDELVASIRSRVREGCTPRHVPGLVVAVDDLPRTRSGKLAELAVADVVNGREVRNTTALANPESLATIAAAVATRWQAAGIAARPDSPALPLNSDAERVGSGAFRSTVPAGTPAASMGRCEFTPPCELQPYDAVAVGRAGDPVLGGRGDRCGRPRSGESIPDGEHRSQVDPAAVDAVVATVGVRGHAHSGDAAGWSHGQRGVHQGLPRLGDGRADDDGLEVKPDEGDSGADEQCRKREPALTPARASGRTRSRCGVPGARPSRHGCGDPPSGTRILPRPRRRTLRAAPARRVDPRTR